MEKKINIKKVFSVIYCIGSGVAPLYYNDIFSGKYDSDFKLHTGLYTGQVLSMLTESDKKKIHAFIDESNYMLD